LFDFEHKTVQHLNLLTGSLAQHSDQSNLAGNNNKLRGRLNINDRLLLTLSSPSERSELEQHLVAVSGQGRFVRLTGYTIRRFQRNEPPIKVSSPAAALFPSDAIGKTLTTEIIRPWGSVRLLATTMKIFLGIRPVRRNLLWQPNGEPFFPRRIPTKFSSFLRTVE